MTKDQVLLISSAVRDQINEIRDAADVRLKQGKHESHDYLRQCADDLETALIAFVQFVDVIWKESEGKQ